MARHLAKGSFLAGESAFRPQSATPNPQSKLVGSLLLLLVGLLLACEGEPQPYDYHGTEPDQHGLDLCPHDAPPLPDLATPDAPDLVDEASQPDLPDPETLADVPLPPDRVRTCEHLFAFAPPDGSAVFLAAEFTDWDQGEIPLEDPDGDGTWTLVLDLSEFPPGNAGYKFHTASDQWFLDPANPLSRWTDGIENSKLIVPDCSLPELELVSWQKDPATGTLVATVIVRTPQDDPPLADSAAVSVNRQPLEPVPYEADQALFDIQLTDLSPGTKVTLEFAIANKAGAALDLVLPVWMDDWTWQDAAIYFTFTDRFANGEPANDDPAGCTSNDSLANWQGGDFPGIRARLESGWFDELGIDVLWLSPVIDNPDGCMTGSLEGITYTAYHGYFPLDITAPEDHFGSMQDLRDLVEAAHARGIRVLVDFVANHLYEECAIYLDHQDDGYFHDFNSCEPDWDKPIECWFMPYLPDLDYTHDAVVEMTTENALYWIRETGIDGFRVDAVKHMVHNFMRSLRHKVETHIVTEDTPFYMVGETFMGEWGGGSGMAETVIKEYVNSWELNGQFDFPFYWKILKAVGRDEGDFVEFADFLTAALPYWGDGALMVSFIGNHDVPRFLSHAALDIADLWGNGSKWQGFTDPPGLPEAEAPYQRLALAIGLLFTLPEIPMIYYGDEVALPGAGDPDNRRVMPWDDLTTRQQAVLDASRRAGRARRELAPLRRGDFQVIEATPDLLVFRRKAEQTVIVAASRKAEPVAIQVPAPEGALEVVEVLLDTPLEFSDGHVNLTLQPFGLAILVAAP